MWVYVYVDIYNLRKMNKNMKFKYVYEKIGFFFEGLSIFRLVCKFIFIVNFVYIFLSAFEKGEM